MLYKNIMESIGNTLMVKLRKLSEEFDCDFYAKCEFMNPGGSVKDRIAYRMVKEAEKEGRIKPGYTLIEASSGNAGIGIALAGAALGYKVIITMPEKMSQEKQVTMAALGAQIIRTPTEAAYDDPESHIEVAKRLEKELPNAVILNQYGNKYNPIAHYDTTGPEIWNDMNGEVSMVVMGAGTGGTITGVSRYIKEKNNNVEIVGVDPEGSILAGPGDIGTYQVEGIGYDFIPDVLDLDTVDTWVKSKDKESFQMALRLIREEGLLCGGSSGTAVWGATQVAGKLKKGENCVIVLPDGIRNYMTKFLDNDWMKQHGFA
ncbi:MAG: pyridoxal-phosphate dependent enzyme [Bdellovibrionales bacterium]